MRKRINKILNKFGLTIEKIEKLDMERIPVMENVFDTDFEKKVLLSYFKTPFVDKWNYNHTNRLECFTAAEIFKELGYNVDVINFWEESDIDFSVYEAVYGLGLPIPRVLAAKYDSATPKVIVYATGCGHSYVDTETGKREKEFFDRTGKIIKTSSRGSEFSVSLLSLVDRGIVLGNEFTMSTYLREGAELPLVNLDAFYYDTYDIDLEKKDFTAAHKHILWFGSGGLLHKGLDLVIEAMNELPEVTLHIAGASENEKEFYKYYSDALSGKVANIINHGFLKLDSKEFRKVMDTCSAGVFPSVSEGGSPSVLNIIANGGLIPILSGTSGLDVGEFGIIMPERSIECVVEKIREFMTLPVDNIKERAFLAKETVRKNYTYDKYKTTLKRYIAEVMAE